MGYCNKNDIQEVIAQTATSATAPTPGDFGTLSPLLNIGSSLDGNVINEDSVNYYIQMADREIDAKLSQLYTTPFIENSNFETVLYSDIYEYNDYIITENVVPLQSGDNIMIIGEGQEERHIIDEAISGTIFSTQDPIQYYFSAGARVVRVSYPNPIKFISARKAAATLYDKFFVAETSPNNSEFGNYLRELADNDIDDILNGVIILHGQHRIGRRFYNSNLVDQYGIPNGRENRK